MIKNVSKNPVGAQERNKQVGMEPKPKTTKGRKNQQLAKSTLANILSILLVASTLTTMPAIANEIEAPAGPTTENSDSQGNPGTEQPVPENPTTAENGTTSGGAPVAPLAPATESNDPVGSENNGNRNSENPVPTDEESAEQPKDAEANSDEIEPGVGFRSAGSVRAAANTQCSDKTGERLNLELMKLRNAYNKWNSFNLALFQDKNPETLYYKPDNQNQISEFEFRVRPGTENDANPIIQVRYTSKNTPNGNQGLAHTRFVGVSVPSFLDRPTGAIYVARTNSNRAAPQPKDTNWKGNKAKDMNQLQRMLESVRRGQAKHWVGPELNQLATVDNQGIPINDGKLIAWGFKFLPGQNKISTTLGNQNNQTPNIPRNRNIEASFPWNVSEMNQSVKLRARSYVGPEGTIHGNSRFLVVNRPSEFDMHYTIYYEARLKDISKTQQQLVTGFVASNTVLERTELGAYVWHAGMKISRSDVRVARRGYNIHGHWDIPNFLHKDGTGWTPEGIRIRYGLIPKDADLDPRGNNLVRGRKYMWQENDADPNTLDCRSVSGDNDVWAELPMKNGLDEEQRDEYLRDAMGGHVGRMLYVHSNLQDDSGNGKSASNGAKNNYVNTTSGEVTFHRWRNATNRVVIEVYKDKNFRELVPWTKVTDSTSEQNVMKTGFIRMSTPQGDKPFKIRYYQDPLVYGTNYFVDDYVLRLRPFIYKDEAERLADCAECTKNPIVENKFDGIVHWLDLSGPLAAKTEAARKQPFYQDVIPGYYRIMCQNLSYTNSETGAGTPIVTSKQAGQFYSDAGPFIVGDSTPTVYARNVATRVNMQCTAQRRAFDGNGYLSGNNWVNEPLNGAVLADLETLDSAKTDAKESLTLGISQGTLSGARFNKQNNIQVGYYPILGISTCNLPGNLKLAANQTGWRAGAAIEVENPQGSCQTTQLPAEDYRFLPVTGPGKPSNPMAGIPGGHSMFGPNLVTIADIERKNNIDANPWTDVTFGIRSLRGAQAVGIGLITDIDTSNADFSGEYRNMPPVVQHTTLRLNRSISVNKINGVDSADEVSARRANELYEERLEQWVSLYGGTKEQAKRHVNRPTAEPINWALPAEHGVNWYYFGSKLGSETFAKVGRIPGVSIRDGYPNDSFSLDTQYQATSNNQGFRIPNHNVCSNCRQNPFATGGGAAANNVPVPQQKLYPGAHFGRCTDGNCDSTANNYQLSNNPKAVYPISTETKELVKVSENVYEVRPYEKRLYKVVVPCGANYEPAGANLESDTQVRGWIDFNGDKRFTNNEASNVATCQKVNSLEDLIAPTSYQNGGSLFGSTTTRQATLIFDYPTTEGTIASARNLWMRIRAVDARENILNQNADNASWKPSRSGETEDYLIDTSRPTYATPDSFLLRNRNQRNISFNVLSNDQSKYEFVPNELPPYKDNNITADSNVGQTRQRKVVFLGAGIPTNTAFRSRSVASPNNNYTISNDGKTINVAEEGTYTLNDNGTVTFTPVAGLMNSLPAGKCERGLTPVRYAYTISTGENSRYAPPAADSYFTGSVNLCTEPKATGYAEYQGSADYGWKIQKHLVKENLEPAAEHFNNTTTADPETFVADAATDATTDIRIKQPGENIPARYRLTVQAVKKGTGPVTRLRGNFVVSPANNGNVVLKGNPTVGLFRGNNRVATCTVTMPNGFNNVTLQNTQGVSVEYSCPDGHVTQQNREQMRVKITFNYSGRNTAVTEELKIPAAPANIVSTNRTARVDEKFVYFNVNSADGTEVRENTENNSDAVSRDNSRIYTLYYVDPTGTNKVFPDGTPEGGNPSSAINKNMRDLVFDAFEMTDGSKAGKVAVIDVDLRNNNGLVFNAGKHGIDVRNTFGLCEGTNATQCTPVPAAEGNGNVTPIHAWFKVRSSRPVEKISVKDVSYDAVVLPGARIEKYALKQRINHTEQSGVDILAKMPTENDFDTYFKKHVENQPANLSSDNKLVEQYRLDLEVGARAIVVTDIRGKFSAVRGPENDNFTEGTGVNVRGEELNFQVFHKKHAADTNPQDVSNLFECRLIAGNPALNSRGNWENAQVLAGNQMHNHNAKEHPFKCVLKSIAGTNGAGLVGSAYATALTNEATYNAANLDRVQLTNESALSVKVSYKNKPNSRANEAHLAHRWDQATAGQIGVPNAELLMLALRVSLDDNSEIEQTRSESRNATHHRTLREIKIVPGGEANGNKRVFAAPAPDEESWGINAASDSVRISGYARTPQNVQYDQNAGTSYFPLESAWDSSKRVRIVRLIQLRPDDRRAVAVSETKTAKNTLSAASTVITHENRFSVVPRLSTPDFTDDQCRRAAQGSYIKIACTTRATEKAANNGAGINFVSSISADPSHSSYDSGVLATLRNAYDAERTARITVTRPGLPKVSISDVSYEMTVLPGVRLDKWVLKEGTYNENKLVQIFVLPKTSPEFSKYFTKHVTLNESGANLVTPRNSNVAKIKESYRVDVELGARAAMYTDIRGELTAVDGPAQGRIDEGDPKKIKATDLDFTVYIDKDGVPGLGSKDTNVSNLFECRILRPTNSGTSPNTNDVRTQDEWNKASVYGASELPANAHVNGKYKFKCLPKKFRENASGDANAKDKVFGNGNDANTYLQVKNNESMYADASFGSLEKRANNWVLRVEPKFRGIPEANQRVGGAYAAHEFSTLPKGVANAIGDENAKPHLVGGKFNIRLDDKSIVERTAIGTDNSELTGEKYRMIRQIVKIPDTGVFQNRVTGTPNVDMNLRYCFTQVEPAPKYLPKRGVPTLTQNNSAPCWTSIYTPESAWNANKRMIISHEIRLNEAEQRSLERGNEKHILNRVALHNAENGQTVPRLKSSNSAVANQEQNLNFRQHYPVAIPSSPGGLHPAVNGLPAALVNAYDEEMSARIDVKLPLLLIKKLKENQAFDTTENGLRGADFILRRVGAPTTESPITVNERENKGIYETSIGFQYGQSYDLIETRAPQGYSLLPVPIRIKVSDTGEVTLGEGFTDFPEVLSILPPKANTADRDSWTVVIKDPEAIQTLPVSGGLGVIWILLLGLGIIGIGAWLGFKKNQK